MWQIPQHNAAALVQPILQNIELTVLSSIGMPGMFPGLGATRAKTAGARPGPLASWHARYLL